jgi:hypothetical protein
MRRAFAGLLLAVAASVSAGTVGAELSLRARVVALTPDVPVRILWRWGGEGLGGSVVRGELTAIPAKAPRGPEAAPLERKPEGDIPDLLDDKPRDRVVEETKDGVVHYLHKGVWTRAVPVSDFRRKGLSFITFTLQGLKGVRDITGVVMELEVLWRGTRVELVREAGPDGPTVGLVLPLHLLAEHAPDSEAFRDGLMGLLEYATRRAEALERLPWAKRPVPTRYGILTDCGGYGAGAGYGIRHTNKTVFEVELRTLRQLGVSGLRGAPGFLHAWVDAGRDSVKHFARIREIHGPGYPVPSVRRSEGSGRIVRAPEGAGCPYHPDVAGRMAEAAAKLLADVREAGVDEVWALTVDEIGSVFDRSPEGKGHQSVCPRCIEGFRDYVRGLGLTPDDFEAKGWSDVRPNAYWPRGQEPPKPWLPERGWGLLTYYSRRFNCATSARLFEPLRLACEEANKAGQKPQVYSFALRGNTFLMRGHSLDFFNFYRHADSAFVYETSNRDPRVWQWDSYLCDVGRVLKRRMGKQFGIYVKPHRGAPVQRALAAVARGATMLFWYTYGPDYKKGDSFSSRPDVLAKVSRAARLIGAAEDVLHGSKWVVQPKVAVVRPRTSEIWGNDAAWENGKWVYTALQHAHVPVDPIDEGMLMEDLSRYQVIYVSGTHLRRDAAEKLAAWVKAGGNLFTSGWGLARDEANHPLDVMLPVLGLRKRDDPEMWCEVRRYGATRLSTFAKRKASPPEGELWVPIVGLEALDPREGSEVMVKDSDGRGCMVRSRWGRGQAITSGFFEGLEYAAKVHRDDFDMSKDFNPALRNRITEAAADHWIVDAGHATVEGILVRNPKSGKLAVCLMNWTYRGRELVPFEGLRVRVRHAAGATRARSCWLDRDLTVTRAGDGKLELALPRLEEGDVILLE